MQWNLPLQKLTDVSLILYLSYGFPTSSTVALRCRSDHQHPCFLSCIWHKRREKSQHVWSLECAPPSLRACVHLLYAELHWFLVQVQSLLEYFSCAQKTMVTASQSSSWSVIHDQKLLSWHEEHWAHLVFCYDWLAWDVQRSLIPTLLNSWKVGSSLLKRCLTSSVLPH